MTDNLPAQLTSFIGRDREIDLVRDALARHRLVTLTGPGGIGKTRLAIELGTALSTVFEHGVWLIELAALVGDPALVARAVALELGVREEPERSLLDSLIESIGTRPMLLLLDNCEHLVQASATLADGLLRACPRLRILATSREALGVPGERVCQVPPLSLPSADSADSEAVQLFVDRARSGTPEFELTEGNRRPVANICRELDGIPLAIELAAARLRMLSVDQLAARLHDRFRLLSAGYRTAAPRHQTLRAVLDWSHDLLGESERIMLRRLAVFAGGFTIEAIEGVCDLGPPTFELLASLVNKSWVVAEGGSAHSRYHLLETVRQYAAEKLVHAGENESIRDAHVGWFVGLALRSESELRGAAQAAWLDRLNVEHENLRAALGWALERVDGAEQALRLAAAVWWFWRERGYASEGRQWLERGLSASGEASPQVRGRALDAAGALAHSQGAYGAARAYVEDALEVWRATADRHGMMTSLNTLGIVAKAEGDHVRAAQLLSQVVELGRELGEAGRVATGLNNLGALCMDQGDYPRAKALIEESLDIKRDLGDRVGMVAALHNLGDVAFHMGTYREAADLLVQSVALSRSLGATHRSAQSLHSLGMTRLQLGQVAAAIADLREGLRLFQDMGDEWGMALCLEGLAQAAISQRAGAELGVHCFAAASAWREANGSPVPPNDRVDYDRSLGVARAVLSEEGFQAAWQLGRSLSLAQAADEALQVVPRVPIASDGLSPREREVAELVSRGLTNRQIADQLGISKTTADRHVSNILVKRGFASRAQLAAWVVRQQTA